jgi:adenine phosphoribosyltransferase
MNILDHVPIVPDWPKPGINFFDVTGILAEPAAFDYCCGWLEHQAHWYNASSLVAVESRGFVFAAPVARQLGLPLVLVRKRGKLPGNTIQHTYQTEYSTDTIEMHPHAAIGSAPLIVDDLLATGGTIMATADLIRSHWAATKISAAVIINLQNLPGASALTQHNIMWEGLVNVDE